MDSEQWQRVMELYHATLALEPAKRASFLDLACNGQENVRQQVDLLIRSHEQSANFLETPAYEVAPELLVDERARMSAGQAIGHYRIESVLGVGGMGEVYLAQDEQLGRKVALKLLADHLTMDETQLNRFKSEARTASALNHPNIVTIHEIGEVDTTQYIATEFIEGITLRDQLSERRIPLTEALDIAIQVASALSAAHAAGIVHRDIKPENIMVRHDGYVKVLDFGIAKLAEPQVPVGTPREEAISLVKTNVGLLLGTLRYMSPEQARGESVDARTDIWSLGVVLYEMVAGTAPFKGDTSRDVISSTLTLEPPPLLEFVPTVPDKLQQIITKALRKDREERYNNVTEMMEALKSLRRDMEIAAELALSTLWRRWIRAPVFWILVFLTGALAFALPLLWVRSKSSQIDQARANLVAAQSIKAARRIAVLPFKPMAPEGSDEYLEVGMADALITKLSNLKQLIVRPTSAVRKYGDAKQDPVAAGRELQVEAVLDGAVQRLGERVRVTARLIKIPEGTTLWADKFDQKFTDIFALQDSISARVAGVLSLKLTGEEKQNLAKRYIDNVEAYQLYLKGRFFASKATREGLSKAVECYEQAIALDANYALAYAGLTDTYVSLDFFGRRADFMSKAKNAAIKSVEIDGTLAESHLALGRLKMDYEWDWAGAETEFRRSIELSPNNALAHFRYEGLLTDLGRFGEAEAELQKAQQIDPAYFWNPGIPELYNEAHQPDKAIDRAKKAIEINPNAWLAYVGLGDAYYQKRMFSEALAAFQQAATLSQNRIVAAQELGIGYAVTGKRSEAEKTLAQMKELSKHEQVLPTSYAYIYALLGEKDLAFAWLDKAYKERDPQLSGVKADPLWDNLRSDPRFAELLKRMNFPP